MARAATIEAFRKRGIAKKTAELLADAGFTLETLSKAKPERLRKFLPEKDAARILQKLGVAPVEKPAPKARKPARPKAAKAGAEEEKEVEAPPKVPQKAPPFSKGETEISDLLEGMGRRLPRSIVSKIADKTLGLKVTKKKMTELLQRVCERYDAHRIDPNESAGIVSAQSIGEPGTQMSIPYGEKVVVREEGRVRVAPIGEIVDALMDRYSVTREGSTEWCDLPQTAFLEVSSLTDGGRLVWKRVRSASRHRYRGSLLRLRTRSGREITATANHSFVTRENGRIAPILGTELRVADRIPVALRLPVGPVAGALDLAELLPMNEYWYGSELAMARALGKDWREGIGRDVTVPVRAEMLGRQLRGQTSSNIEDGFVYPSGGHSGARIPERIPLDATFGWLVGAYLSEGWAARYHTNISNTDERFLARTRRAADAFGVRYAAHANNRGFARGRDLHLRSVVLSDLLRKMCGVGSSQKQVPDLAFGAGDPFVGALLRAYFEGDGNVTVVRGAIRASSNSKNLIDGIALLLARFGILTSKGLTNGQYTLWIPRRFAVRFRDAIGFESRDKREALDRLCIVKGGRYTYDALDMVAGFGGILRETARKVGMPSRHVNNFTKRQRIGRATLLRYVERFERLAAGSRVDIRTELGRLRALADEDVFWDEIVSIDRTGPPEAPVYDFSVLGLETFTTGDGVVTHNTMRTFHYAGVAEMNVTLGLPRLIEIVDARRVPSTPIMEVHIKEGAKDIEKMRRIAQEIEMTNLEDIAEIETDLVNMQILIYPDENRMRVRGVTYADLEERLRKFALPKEIRRSTGSGSKTVKGFFAEAGEPSFKKLQRVLETVKSTRIKGIDGIRRAIIRRRGDRYVIYTEGSNLAKVLELPYADPTQTTTNSIQEIFDVLGVEAARNAIIKEADDTLQEQGLTVDLRHIMLVADMMTNDGDVKAIGRHGISGRKSSVLARAAFEITAHHLLHAAITGEIDNLDGVAENVIVGQPVTLGTGAVNLVYRPPGRSAVQSTKGSP